ncbi:peptide deformylase [Aquiluna sp. Uisw_065]|uniref:peptide deformylase n=1 Tax=Aquiluna sp. Uisw_065 TaxID=3230967 RepID=UPI0039EBB1D6
MTLYKIRITGDPALHTRALEVLAIDDYIRELVADMFETMDAAPGVGLAATQIGAGLRIFVYSYSTDDQEVRGVAINPQLSISEFSDEELDEEADAEGCLSIPGERFPLKRANRALLMATDLDGHGYQIEAEGWLARIFQHEFDHLEGMLYADRLVKPHKRLMKKAIKENEWGVPGLSWSPGQDYLEP